MKINENPGKLRIIGIVLLQIVVISSFVNNEVSAAIPSNIYLDIPNVYEIPNVDQLRDLVKNRLIPHFQCGGLVKAYKEQFAVVIFQPHPGWSYFRYNPSFDGDGKKPLIRPACPRSPSDLEEDRDAYNNYLAARPRKGKDAEIRIMNRLDELYDGYMRNHNNNAPQAVLIYSWTVPCMTCTDTIARKFASGKYQNIPTKVVAYTTKGGESCGADGSACDERYTIRELNRVGIDSIVVHHPPPDEDCWHGPGPDTVDRRISWLDLWLYTES